MELAMLIALSLIIVCFIVVGCLFMSNIDLKSDRRAAKEAYNKLAEEHLLFKKEFSRIISGKTILNPVYFSYYGETQELEAHESLTEAMEHIQGGYEVDDHWRIDRDSFVGIATHAFRYVETDNKANYMDESEWPHDPELQSIGEIKMKVITVKKDEE